MHEYSDNRPSRSSRSIGVSYITVTRKHSSRRLCTQLGRATLDLMLNSRITTTRPIRVFFCYKVGPPTSGLNSYHKGLSAVGLDLPTDSLGLQTHLIICILCPIGVCNCAKPSRRISNRSRRERGWNRGVTCRFVCFIKRMCGEGRRPRRDGSPYQLSPQNGYREEEDRGTIRR